MRVHLISHASVIVETDELVLWTDPWLFGDAFNDSWSLHPPAAWDPAWLDRITHLWISHEHPDHFHLPTLRSLPAEFKARVELLFQQGHTDKMFQAFRRLGFERARPMPHREWLQVGPTSHAWCYQVGQMDSALALRADGKLLLNVNDAELSPGDLEALASELPRPDLLLNQFSLAGYGGMVDHARYLPPKAAAKLDSVVHTHRALGAAATLPFASFVYFSREDNAYLNPYTNSPRAVHERFVAEGLGLYLLAPGQGAEVGRPPPPGPALAVFDEASAALSALPLRPGERVALGEIQRAFTDRALQLRGRYPLALLSSLGQLTVRVPDLDTCLRLDLRGARATELPCPEGVDLEIASQPLHHCFDAPWGVQTLGVSGRLRLYQNEARWRRWRALFSLNNAELPLRPSLLLEPETLAHLKARARGGVGQLLHRLKIRRDT